MKSDVPLTADPNSKEWKSVQGVTAEHGPRGNLTAGHKTEIRSRWSDNDLYFLFICQFEQLYLKPNPSTTSETPRLWDWDVAEVFIGSDFQNIKRYREFQVSPHGEWVDLDIDRNPTPPNHNMQWNSGYQVKARIDEKSKIWYGVMRIPIDKIESRKPQAGQDLRINFFRFQGPPPDRKSIAWQPTNADNFHVPEAFGRLHMEE
ncbi:MAG TPA: carbohydrate-binding family 9-like protein [Terriglobia bacterium]|nr:carbohydrate-binding family 9-like protein [Terriglobia bacterium]